MSHGVIHNGTYYKKEKEKDQLRMAGGSWSINLDELDDTVHTIVFESELNEYTISLIEATIAGFERQLGGELKLIVPLRHWKVSYATPRKA